MRAWGLGSDSGLGTHRSSPRASTASSPAYTYSVSPMDARETATRRSRLTWLTTAFWIVRSKYPLASVPGDAVPEELFGALGESVRVIGIGSSESARVELARMRCHWAR